MPRTGSLPDKIAWSLVLAGAASLMSGVLRDRRRMNFRNASIIITGGSRGLGLEMARVFAREGARLALLARDREELERARRELIALGGYVLVVQCDIRNEEEVNRAVEAVVARRGRVDVLVNNASVIQVGPFENTSLQDFEAGIDVHVRGPLYLIKAAVPIMKLQGRGRIVNISSIGGVVAIPHLLPYTASKFALTGLSDGLRAELARDGIRVTTVVPGLMRTGSHVNAVFKGRHRKEYAWFAASAGSPLLSINAERAARRIVEACRYGDAYLVLSVPARFLKTINTLLPGIAAAAMKIAARALPSPGGLEANEARTGWESRYSAIPSLLTLAADKAIGRNNEQKSFTTKKEPKEDTMATTRTDIAVYGIYKNRVNLEEAVNALKAAGFRNTDISVLFPETAGSKEFAHKKGTKLPEGAATGGASGAAIGGALGWLAGIGTLAIPGVGPFIAAGPIVSLLAGAGVGGSVGWLVGALVGLGIPEYEAKLYEGRIKEGGILLSVHSDNPQWKKRAKTILESTGAADIGSKGEAKAA